MVPAARVINSGDMPTDVLTAQLPNTIARYDRHHPGPRRRGPRSHRLPVAGRIIGLVFAATVLLFLIALMTL